ncbi:hypothetical protein Scep_028178 [Stephania cephalantha]|uniref:Uncharacterized protein n=1 Tax=Stephania cephalantha TaxID=152367 RepID=A0AAP0E9G7_9MAGN
MGLLGCFDDKNGVCETVGRSYDDVHLLCAVHFHSWGPRSESYHSIVWPSSGRSHFPVLVPPIC